MKIFIISILFLIFTNISIAEEKKCTWNIFKSNCKFQKISDGIGAKTGKSIEKFQMI